MKARYKTALSEYEVRQEVKKEYDKHYVEHYREIVQQIVPQLFAVCLHELEIEFGFRKTRLNRFYSGVNDLFYIMENGGILGHEFNAENCIKRMAEEYGIKIEISGDDINIIEK